MNDVKTVPLMSYKTTKIRILGTQYFTENRHFGRVMLNTLLHRKITSVDFKIVIFSGGYSKMKIFGYRKRNMPRKPGSISLHYAEHY